MRCLDCLFPPAVTASKQDKDAATTISRFVRGKKARNDTRMIKARTVLKEAHLKLKVGLMPQKRVVMLSGDDESLQVAKPESSSTIIDTLSFAAMKPARADGTSIVLTFSNGAKPVTFKAASQKDAQAYAEAVNVVLEKPQ